MSEWQPIKTAPLSDSDAILVFGGLSFDIAWVGWFEDEKPVWFNGFIRVSPTHWQPLPEPPSE